MKIFDLLCVAGHRFEGWFASAEDYSNQRTKGLVNCPSCGAREVERVPSATRFNSGASEPAQPTPGAAAAPAGHDALALAQRLYSRMLDELLTKSEDVGEQFPEEARRIHYKDAPARSIRGRATQEEHDSLLEEGIPVARLPIPPSGRWN
jgi:hypothetical protein